MFIKKQKRSMHCNARCIYSISLIYKYVPIDNILTSKILEYEVPAPFWTFGMLKEFNWKNLEVLYIYDVCSDSFIGTG